MSAPRALACQLSWLLVALVTLGCARPTDEAEGSAGALPPGAARPRLPVAAAREYVQRTPTSVARVKASGQLGPGRGTLVLELAPGPGRKLTVGAPLRVRGTGQDVHLASPVDTTLELAALPLRLPIDVEDGALGPLELDVSYYWCSAGDAGSCQPERAKLTVDLDLSGEHAGGEASLTHSPSA